MLFLVQRNYANSPNAAVARGLVEELQALFVDALQKLSVELGVAEKFEFFEWLRDEGRHGGGNRYAAIETPMLNRAAVNVSSVHYDDDPQKILRSADALSTIIHPRNPFAPSVHMHFSWTEMRDGRGYYRMMADLNPSTEDLPSTSRFQEALREATPEHYEEAAAQGDRYFKIPALDRHRGATHFYLEGFSTGDFAADTEMAGRIARAAIASYVEILHTSLCDSKEICDEDRQRQLAYHTVYLFQVLTLDRGTTSGLLVHDQNDLGIMGSLPAYVDRDLLASWAQKIEPPQDALVLALVDCLESAEPSHVTDDVRCALAQAVRSHYEQHPEALAMQAAGNVIPPTVQNHKAKQ